MANDKITMLKLKRLLQLLSADQSQNRICKELGKSKSCTDYIRYFQIANFLIAGTFVVIGCVTAQWGYGVSGITACAGLSACGAVTGFTI